MKGKVILITGAAAGIGAATAEHFARLGAALALVDINGERLNELVQKNESIFQAKPLIIVADVRKDAQRIIDATVSHFGHLDVLVNNAGTAVPGGIETTTLEQFDDIMNLNVRSVLHLTMIAVPHLLKTKGNIVNVSSAAGLRAAANLLAYCMSKSALDQFTRCVALELAPKGVRVNAVNPGSIITDLHYTFGRRAESYEEFLAEINSKHPLGRAGTAVEVAAGIAFLANEESASFVTGTTLPIDGGRILVCSRR